MGSTGPSIFSLHGIKYHVRKFCPWLVPVHRWFFALRNGNRPVEAVFTDIYRKKWWGSAETVSGVGSLLVSTRTLRRELPLLFKKYSVTSVLDIPCGDFNWMKEVDLAAIAYTGADIVEELIKDNNARYPGIRFVQLDIIKDPLPSVDLILCKDLMIHLSTDAIFSVIKNLKASGATYLLATTSVDPAVSNTDIPSGYFRKINLRNAPFNFPAPLEVIAEDDEALGSACALWRISDL